jgi:hypothetical protein
MFFPVRLVFIGIPCETQLIHNYNVVIDPR